MSENETPSVQIPSSNSVPPSDPAALPNDERLWAVCAHLSALSLFFTIVGCVIGPLVVWLLKRDETSSFAADQAREALNFNITFVLVCLALVVMTVGTLFIGIVITLPLFGIVLCAWFVMTIVAVAKANDGIAYRYPFVWRIVK